MPSAPTSEDLAAARAAAARPLASAVAADPGLPRRLATADWSAGQVDEGGQFHRVLVLPGVGAVRIARTAGAAALLPGRMAMVAALGGTLGQGPTPALPFAVPAPLSEVVTAPSGEAMGLREGTAAVVQRFLPGQPHPPHEGDPELLRGVCEVLAGIETAPLVPHLGPPFGFRGPWAAEKVAVVQALPELLTRMYGSDAWTGSGAASADRWAGTVTALTGTATRWTECPVVPPSLVHGDLAGHNMRWQRRSPGGDGGRWELTGILDWDLAAVWDPALNPAYLALWHGEEKLEAIARDAAEAWRARVWLGCMALESLYDASLREGPSRKEGPPHWAKLLRKVLPRIERAAAAEAVWRTGHTG
ncbi:phosphotransferase family protein [Citricoccus nitrophenolicus]|uniref:phosphotransferase family protein n=1 Tax=Citricoccus nitrophenolicus TaxID=863575 RepID=UPI0031ECC47B